MLRWWIVATAVLAAAAIVSFVMLGTATSKSGSEAVQRFVTMKRAAPAISLHTPRGVPVSLASLRGRRVIVTFIDPRCRELCVPESLVIADALRRLPVAERPVVLAVSVDPRVRSAVVLEQQARRFKWTSQFRWAVGTHAQLARVWKAYKITVLIPPKGEIVHSEAAYVIDANGDERALLLWPFRTRDVSAALAGAAS